MLNKEWSWSELFLKEDQGKFGAAVKNVGFFLVAELVTRAGVSVAISK